MVFADIGCDHAYAACAVALRNNAARVIACDSSKYSLGKAAATVERFSLDSRVELRLGDGLDPLENNEADTVLIAGMGAHRIIHILESGRHKAKSLKRIVLCPHSNVPTLRAYLLRNGYSIEREALAFENNFYYELLQVRYDGHFWAPGIFECEIGSRSLYESDALLMHYVKFRITQIDKIISSAEGRLPSAELSFKLELKHILEDYLLWLSR